MVVTWHHVTVLPALGCILLALALADESAPVAAPLSGIASAEVRVPGVRSPAYEEFDAFWRDDDNPFVPYAERHVPGTAADGSGGWRAPAPAPAPGPSPQRPERDLPRAIIPGAALPVPVGYCSGERLTWIRVRDPQNGRVLEIKPGANLNGFSFVGLEAGNIAVFKDETERVYRLVIGTR